MRTKGSFWNCLINVIKDTLLCHKEIFFPWWNHLGSSETVLSPCSHVNQSMSWCNDGFLPHQEGWGWHGPMANCWSEPCCRWGVREGNGLHKLRAVITRVHASSAGLCGQHASTHRYRDYISTINWSKEFETTCSLLESLTLSIAGLVYS